MTLPRPKLLLLPFLFFNLLAAAGLGIEFYNHYFRGVSTPFLLPALGLILLSLFFIVNKKWMYIALAMVTVLGTAIYLQVLFWQPYYRPSIVYNYQSWEMNTQNGRVKLLKPLGSYSPTSGPYVSCNFSLTEWWHYLDNQPLLCTAFDDRLGLLMYLNDNEAEQGVLREFQLNQFNVDRKSLLGEPLDRMATRIAFVRKGKGLWAPYRMKALYQVYEREVSPGHTRVIESFARDGKGALKSFTESSLLNLTSKDLFAVYNDQGLLTEIPQMVGRSFAFPAKVDTSSFSHYDLPLILRPGDRL